MKMIENNAPFLSQKNQICYAIKLYPLRFSVHLCLFSFWGNRYRWRMSTAKHVGDSLEMLSTTQAIFWARADHRTMNVLPLATIWGSFWFLVITGQGYCRWGATVHIQSGPFSLYKYNKINEINQNWSIYERISHLLWML